MTFVENAFVGGATLFGVTVSWPFMKIEITDEGLGLGWRGSSSLQPGRLFASFRWSEMVAIQVARRDVSWYDRQRSFYRFSSISGAPIEAVITKMLLHEVPYETVSSSWQRPFTQT